MSSHGTFEHFESELTRLVAHFHRHLADFKGPDYDEANVRKDFLDPFFRALGWDMDNRAGLIPRDREVEIESRTSFGGSHRRADYLFRAGGIERFVCEAKKPSVELDFRHAFQAKRYAWNKGVAVAVLTDFEHLKIYVVGGRPSLDQPEAGLWKEWGFQSFPGAARELWDVLSRPAVAGGQLERMLETLPKKASGKGRGGKGWVLRPDRTRALDADFLDFLDEARRGLASDLYRLNEREDLREGTRLHEAVHRILDRLLFLRICEDRDIDTGTRLDSILGTWRRNRGMDDDVPGRARQQVMMDEPPGPGAGASRAGATEGTLWRAVSAHFRALDQRPPSHVPFFNGNLFKEHFSEELVVGDRWLAGFIADVSDEESPYLFDVIPVEMLGTIYERFLGKVVRPHGRGITVEEKPEVRKAGGVYYTPRYIVDHIVEETVGRLVAGRDPEATLGLRILDPACGSGSFLIRAYERMCEHWQRHLAAGWRRVIDGGGDRAAWEKRHRASCRVDEADGSVHLTVELKRRILTANIHGVDLDAAAVEVTQLSLYLKMLEGENRTTLRRERELFAAGTALLPPLSGNIKCGNSLVASDFSMVPEDLVRVNAFDWSVQFPGVMASGGFDAVIGNPPYVLMQDEFRDDAQLEYFRGQYEGASYKIDTYHLFIERGMRLTRPGGFVSFITPSNFLANNHLAGLRRVILGLAQPEAILVIEGGVFAGASVDCAVMVLRVGGAATAPFSMSRAAADATGLRASRTDEVFPGRVLAERSALFTAGIVNKGSDLWDRLAARCQPLGSVADVNFGKQLRDRARHPSDVIEVEGRDAIPPTHVACVTGRDVERYDLRWSGLACLDDTEAQRGGCWDASKHQARGKLLTRQIGRHPTFAMDAVGYHCLNTVFMVTARPDSGVSPAYLMGILNSKVIRALWLGRFYDQRTTFPKIKGSYLKELPIPRLDLSSPGDKARHDQLVGWAEKMLSLAPRLRDAREGTERDVLRNAMAATDRQIDAGVQGLFGLDPDEVATVERAAGP